MLNELDQKRLEVAMAQLEKDFGAGAIYRLGDENIKPAEAISTGALTLDLALGIGGLPKGRVVEIYGPESSGKSTIALTVVAESQKDGGTCAYIDAEHAVDPQYAKNLGVDMDDLLFSQPDHAEMALDIVLKLLRTGTLDVVVIDSVAALTPKKELEGDMDENQPGVQAKLMAKAMRLIVAAANENNTLVIFINQLRQKIGVMFGNPETTPGGLALKFAASVRLDIRKIENIKGKTDGEIMGVRTKVKVIKNKMAPPLRQAEFDILYGRGVNSVGCVLDLAVDKGYVEKKGAWYYYEGESLGQGRDSAMQALSQDLDMVKALKGKILGND